MYYPQENLTCKSKDEIDAMLSALQTVFVIKYQYFDSNDFDNPIRTKINTDFQPGLVAGVTQLYTVGVQKNDISR